MLNLGQGEKPVGQGKGKQHQTRPIAPLEAGHNSHAGGQTGERQ